MGCKDRNNIFKFQIFSQKLNIYIVCGFIFLISVNIYIVLPNEG